MRTSCRVRTTALASALFLLLPALARAEAPVNPYPACERTPTKGDSAAAEGAFQAGNAAYGEADYDRAINYWEDAYRRDCTAHPMLLNLARAYEISGQKRHAVNALRTYLARNPNASDEGQIRRRIEKLDEQIQAESTTATPPPAGPTQVAQPAAMPVGAPPPVGMEAPPPPSGKRPIGPLIVVGVGGVAAIVGGIIFVGASSDVSDFEAQCPNRKCAVDAPGLTDEEKAAISQQRVDDGNSALTKRTVGGVVGGVGLAAIVGGLIWYFTSKPSSPPPATALVPAIGPGFGGANFVGTF